VSFVVNVFGVLKQQQVLKQGQQESPSKNGFVIPKSEAIEEAAVLRATNLATLAR